MNLDPAIHLIEEFEGCVLHAYHDAVGVLTIGYGTTHNVHPGMVITKEEAIKLLLDDCKIRAEHILSKVKVAINDHELGALLSLAYNIGLSAFDSSSLLRKLNDGAPRIEVADSFMSWVHAGGRVLPGLVRRRRAEREMFLSHSAITELT